MGESGESVNCLWGLPKLKQFQIMVEEAIQNFKEEEKTLHPWKEKPFVAVVNDSGHKTSINGWIYRFTSI